MTREPFESAALADIAAKIEAGERLDLGDGVALYASRDIHEIGRLANMVRERLHHDAAYYNVNRHVNYTNYCVLRCKFCSFYMPFDKTISAGAAGAYEMSVEQVLEQAKEAYQAGATEVHIVGGLHPKLPFSYYVELCRAIRQACPRMHIKAFTAIEIIHFSRIAKPRRTVRQVLEELRAEGLDSLPGGGAEIFDDRVHDEAYKNKVGEEGWFDVHRIAHEMGVFTNATMLYGHIERPEERIAHMLKLRAHQDESLRSRQAAFNCFVPLPFAPAGSELSHLPGPTGLDNLKTLAISRLMLDNFPHIKAFWVMHSAKLAQVSLNWGVDDIDGTVIHYDITGHEGSAPRSRDDSSVGPPRPTRSTRESLRSSQNHSVRSTVASRHQELTVSQLENLIREAGRRPVERDTLYRQVIRHGTDWHLGERL